MVPSCFTPTSNVSSKENSGYLIRKMTGLYESFEREYYDLIRSAFLKYKLVLIDNIRHSLMAH